MPTIVAEVTISGMRGEDNTVDYGTEPSHCQVNKQLIYFINYIMLSLGHACIGHIKGEFRHDVR